MTEQQPEGLTVAVLIKGGTLDEYAVGDVHEGDTVIEVREAESADFALAPLDPDFDPMVMKNDDPDHGVVLTLLREDGA